MKLLSLDFETSIGDSIHKADFRDSNNDIYTQIFARSENEVRLYHDPQGFKRKLNMSLGNYDLIIGHNLGFDLCYVWNDPQLRAFILRGGKIWDTQIAEYLLTGQQHAFSSLAELQLKHLGVVEKPSRISFLYKKGIGADKIVQARERCPRLWELYEEYCRTDGSTPIKIYKKQLAIAQREGMMEIIELWNGYLLGICSMTCSGVLIDKVRCEKTLRDFNLEALEYLNKAQELVREYWNDPRLPTFNINSPDHKSAVLFGGTIKAAKKEKIQIGLYKNGNPRYESRDVFIRVDGFRVPTSISRPAKKSGLFSTDDGVMIQIGNKTKNPLLKQYCEYQKESMMFKKAAKTYCQAFIERSVNSVLHVNFNNTTTITGRLSSSKPNLQNVSKRNKFAKPLHKIFIAPEGWTCVQIDFNQLEIWVLAFLSQDPVLTERLLSGIDMHITRLQYYNENMTYEELYKLAKTDKDPYWHKEREGAKTLSYRKAYGAGVKTIAESTGIPEDIVKIIFSKEDETYVDAAAFPQKVRDMMEETKAISLAVNIPSTRKGNNKDSAFIVNGLELCPIFDKNGNVSYTNNEPRYIGYYKSILGQKWSFDDSITETKWGSKRKFTYTQTMNYPMQGTAAAIQGATTAALLRALISKENRIKMINEVHDSKWFYVRDDVLEPCLKWLKETIEDVPKIFLERFGIEVPFKFPVEIEVGKNFGEMEKYEL